MEKVVLIDFNDNVIGEMEKMQAHVEGQLHRAFSVFLYHGDKMLIHKRASEKYHGGGLWTNSCCSHRSHCSCRSFHVKNINISFSR